MNIFPQTYFPEVSLARMYSWPNGHFPENLFSRIDACQNVHLGDRTFPRKLIFQNKITLSPKSFLRKIIKMFIFFIFSNQYWLLITRKSWCITVTVFVLNKSYIPNRSIYIQSFTCFKRSRHRNLKLMKACYFVFDGDYSSSAFRLQIICNFFNSSAKRPDHCESH